MGPQHDAHRLQWVEDVWSRQRNCRGGSLGKETATGSGSIIRGAPTTSATSTLTTANAESAARQLAGEGVPTFGEEVVEQGLSTFARSPMGVLGLANRYDGMDLPGDDCRIVVLDGKPDAVSLQEKFLSERADASAANAERLRTRIVQGAGRATRGPNDYAVVVVVGSDITRYLSRPENQTALEPELQAEVQFGWDQVPTKKRTGYRVPQVARSTSASAFTSRKRRCSTGARRTTSSSRPAPTASRPSARSAEGLTSRRV